jgi:predicted secreted Zn-dependent protease
LVLSAISLTPASAEWQAVERIETYAISGNTGLELYTSIGARGPVAGLGRAIAHTSFKLTWTRKYEPRNGACVLSSARPKLIITYVLPKPARKLSGAVARDWQRFIDGVLTHEKVHGADIVAMVREIEATSIGLTVADDPKCRKIREELTRRLALISQAQRQRSRDFDRVEIGAGGNIHQLVLALVNGG